MTSESTSRPDPAAALAAGVVPATGCTEPVAVALAAAVAARQWRRAGGQVLTSVRARVSPNVMKNGMAVVVPGTGTPGLAVAAAVGALAGDPDAGLGVLGQVGPEEAEQARRMVEEGLVRVDVDPDAGLLHARVEVEGGGHRAGAVIDGSHTHVVEVSADGHTVESHDPLPGHGSGCLPGWAQLLQGARLHDLYRYCMEVPLDELDLMRQAASLNTALVEVGMSGRWGLGLGATLAGDGPAATRRGGEHDLLSAMVEAASAAADARMGGAPLPAMTNSGSGNQGITATVPVCVAAEHTGADEDTLLRGLALSHLTALYVHSGLPVLSAFCAATTAGMGAAAGVCHVLGGGWCEVEAAVASMAGDVAGMVCDGAGCSCALKVASSVSAAGRAVSLAMAGVRVPGTSGLVADDVDTTIRGLWRLAGESMAATDREVLSIMVDKAPRPHH